MGDSTERSRRKFAIGKLIRKLRLKINNYKTKLMVSSSKDKSYQTVKLIQVVFVKRVTTNSMLCVKCTKWKVKSVMAEGFGCKRCK